MAPAAPLRLTTERRNRGTRACAGQAELPWSAGLACGPGHHRASTIAHTRTPHTSAPISYPGTRARAALSVSPEIGWAGGCRRADLVDRRPDMPDAPRSAHVSGIGSVRPAVARPAQLMKHSPSSLTMVASAEDPVEVRDPASLALLQLRLRASGSAAPSVRGSAVPRNCGHVDGQLPVRPWLLPGRAVLACTVHGLDEIDAGEELLAVVVFAQLRPGCVYGRVFSGVELRPLRGDGGEES